MFSLGKILFITTSNIDTSHSHLNELPLENFQWSNMNRKFLRVQLTQQAEEANSETSNQASKQPLLKYRMNKSLLRNHFVLYKEQLSLT